MCPEEARASWAEEVVLLAELARYEEARALAERIDHEGDDVARQAAARARALIEARNRVFPDTTGAKKEMRLRLVEATAAWEQAQMAAGEVGRMRDEHARAEQLFLGAWKTWHPNGEALYGAGRSAQALGETALAQRIWKPDVLRRRMDARGEIFPVAAPDLAGLDRLMWRADAPFERRPTADGGAEVLAQGRSAKVLLLAWLAGSSGALPCQRDDRRF